MSGHSKWHNIQKTKGAQDAKRAATFTKIAKEMYVAVKEGGGSADPNYNSRLATVITKAKAANMPNDNIKRVLEKAANAGSGDAYEAITYEGYGPGGIAVIVETMTDSRNRTAGNVRHHFDKYGGNMGASGCVAWNFSKKGVLVIDNEDEDYTEDDVMMDAMDAGADDFEAEDDCFTIYTQPDDFNAVADALTKKGYTFASAQIEMVPGEYKKLDNPDDVAMMEKMLDIFEDDDDVQNVWHNWDRD
ncbi:MAG: YebC/PmpR family DNA-binding transcriptional regulator [Firmicutes bacterium]|nr:YebC/PmpR family DNA-binding transcriptional regulator [Bacillota bacterium]